MLKASVVAILIAQTTVLQDGAYKGQSSTANCRPPMVCRVEGGRWLLWADAGTGGSGAPTSAQYWVGAADGTLSAEKNLGALSTGLVINTTGTPSAYAGASCSATNYVSAVSASGALTCSVPPGTAAPGGNNTELQYNNSTAFGGIANVETNGTHLSIVPVTTHPSTPSTDMLSYGFRSAADMPVIPTARDAFMGLALPVGAYSKFPTFGGTSGWESICWKPRIWGASTHTVPDAVDTPLGYGTVGVATWDSTTFWGRQKTIPYNTANSTNAPAGQRGNGVQTTWRGNTAGAGGFLFWSRIKLTTVQANNRVAVGLFNSTGALTASSDPSAFADSVYIGCDSGETTLHARSNDNSGSATAHTDLGANFPCTTNGAIYDVWLAAAPNTSSITWFVERLDSSFTATNTITSDLPRNTVQMTWHNWLNTAGSAGILVIGWAGTCVASNW